MKFAQSPLIKNQRLSINPDNGDLVFAPDITTQMAVTLTAYDCIYNSNINSKIIPYLFQLQGGSINSNSLTQIVKNAYQILISTNYITNLQIAIQFVTQNNVIINIKVTDINNQFITLTWDNV